MVRKRMLLSVLVAGMFCSAAFALAPMGPPTAGLPQGSHAVGVGYAHSDMTVEVSGPFSGSATGPEAVINDLQNDLFFVSLGYGISDDWTLYGGVGVADAKFPGDGSSNDFKGDDGFAFGIGTKKTLAEDGDTKWGILGQLTQGKSEDIVRGPGTWGNHSISFSSARTPAKLEWYEVQIALGPTIPLSEDVCVYGGPFLHFMEGDLEIRGSRAEYELEQNLQLGAYVGVLGSLGNPNASLMAEFLYTGSGWGFGIGASFRCP